MLAVRRKCNGAVHVTNQHTRRTAEHGRLVQNGNSVFGFVAANEIEITSVGRKSKAKIARWCRRDDLRIAAGLNVAELQRLQTVFFHHLGEIFSIGGNRSESSVAVVGKIFDGKTFEGLVRGFSQERKNTISRSDQYNECDENGDARAHFVFLCRFDKY